MCTATVDLAADWTRSIAIPFLLQAYLPQSCAQTVLTASRWEGAEREGIKSQLPFALRWWQMCSWLVLSRLVLEGKSRHCLASLLAWGGGCSKDLEEEVGSRVVWIIGGRT